MNSIKLNLTGQQIEEILNKFSFDENGVVIFDGAIEKAIEADRATKAGTADTAIKAEQDENGDNILDTYATKQEISDFKKIYIGTSEPDNSEGEDGDIYIVY